MYKRENMAKTVQGNFVVVFLFITVFKRVVVMALQNQQKRKKLISIRLGDLMKRLSSE